MQGELLLTKVRIDSIEPLEEESKETTNSLFRAGPPMPASYCTLDWLLSRRESPSSAIPCAMPFSAHNISMENNEDLCLPLLVAGATTAMIKFTCKYRGYNIIVSNATVKYISSLLYLTAEPSIRPVT